MLSVTRALAPALCVFAAVLSLSGCSQSTSSIGDGLSAVKSMIIPTKSYAYGASEKERECLARAMFFESNRSSRDGLVAVGSVVMNRKDSGKWGDNICDVVGAKRQFAPGVLSRKMNSKALPDVMAAADAVLKGERHPKVDKEVMFFHTAGLKFPYKNMRYTTVAGGNAFYYKAGRKQNRLPTQQMDAMPGVDPVMIAQAEPRKAEKASNGWFGKKKRNSAEDTQFAFAGDTPANGNPPVRTKTAKVKQVAEEQVAFADEAPLPVATQMRAGIKPSPVAAATADVTAAPVFEAPSEERFGGGAAEPAYGDGSGILGQLVIEGD